MLVVRESNLAGAIRELRVQVEQTELLVVERVTANFRRLSSPIRPALSKPNPLSYHHSSSDPGAPAAWYTISFTISTSRCSRAKGKTGGKYSPNRPFTPMSASATAVLKVSVGTGCIPSP